MVISNIKMKFEQIKYTHIERWDTDEVLHLKDEKTLLVQPKLDGCNGFMYFENDKLVVGSRNRFLSDTEDNQGFYQKFKDNENFKEFFRTNDVILYGEYLTDHSFRVKSEFKKQFVVFDVFDKETKTFLPLKDYTYSLCKNNIMFVPTIKIDASELNNLDKFKAKYKEFSRFLVEDKFAHGEGFVIKSYIAKNKYGRTVYAKVLNEKVKASAMTLFDKIRANFFTDEYIEKETIKFNNNNEEFNIEKYCSIVTNEFLKEELANIVIKYKYPTINTTELVGRLKHILKDYTKDYN